MLGNQNKEQFDPKNYNDFYAHHEFEPLPEEIALSADRILPRVGWALDVAEEIKAESVLDLCCLDGFATLTLANKLGTTGVGVDLSHDGIELATKRAKEHNLPVTFYEGAVEDYEGEQLADLVLLFEAIEHFTDPDEVMNAIKKNLRPGGTLLVSTPDAEGEYGIGNYDPAHLRIYTHKYTTDDLEADKPLVSLPGYIESQGLFVDEVNVWGGIIHVRASLPKANPKNVKTEGFDA